MTEKKYIHPDTGEIWEISEIEKAFNDFRYDSDLMQGFENFADYMEYLVRIGWKETT